MEKLPVELLRELFLYLDFEELKNISLVNKRFYSLSSEITWKNFEFFVENWGKYSLKKKKNFQTNIQKLKITGNSQKELNGLVKFISNCVNLNSLIINVGIINDDDLWIISNYCKNLKQVRLTSTFEPLGKITDQGIQVLCEKTRYILISKKQSR